MKTKNFPGKKNERRKVALEYLLNHLSKDPITNDEELRQIAILKTRIVAEPWNIKTKQYRGA